MLTESSIRSAGFTLLETMVTIGIFAILVMLTVPAMGTWVTSTRMRATADVLQNGVRLAQTESLRRSRQVVFALTNDSPSATNTAFTAAATGKNWVVETIPAMTTGTEVTAFIASGALSSANSTINIQGPAEVCFNSVGRLVVNTNANVPGGGAGCQLSASITYTYRITNGAATVPEYDVKLSLGGQMRLCDPNQTLSGSNPYGC
ncbi:MAG: prepilin-type N-terminal cleavage/methylation domain-containing protein [Pseudomonadota bacterium]|nr:prepilin-type N-terminal cleavage/methylation domain-containing protein [Pseudomonadota bacterium]